MSLIFRSRKITVNWGTVKPPKVVYVGAADYEVKFRKKFDLLGETDNNNTTIFLRREQSPSCQRDTFLHECLHAIIWCSGYGHRLTHRSEEKLVRALTPWILALLRDNPELVEYLLEDAWPITADIELPQSQPQSPDQEA